MKSISIAFGLALLGFGASASAQYSRFYDNFRSGTLDPARWTSAGWGAMCTQPTTLECVREIRHGQLNLGVRTVGDASSNQGITYDQSYINFVNPAAVRSIEMRLVIPAASASGCAANSVTPSSHVILAGRFFNSGSGLAADDVDANLLIGTDSAGVPQASGYLYTNGVFFGTVYLGPVAIGEVVNVSMRWDPSNSQFVFSLLRASGQTVVMAAPYSQTNALPAVNPWRQIGVRNFVANCIGKQTVNQIQATVDHVVVNSAATP